MPKRPKEPSAYPRVDNKQVFSTIRLIPAINQKNYYTNYLKKDSQYLCRKIRERPEGEAQTAVFHVGSLNLRVGLSSDPEPKVLPFCVGKPTIQTKQEIKEEVSTESDDLDEEALSEVRQSFVDRMKFYKTRIVNGASEICRDFNARQHGEPAGESISEELGKPTETSPKYSGSTTKYFCTTNPPAENTLYWPLIRGALNEDPRFYRSPQELVSDVRDILYYATFSEAGMSLETAEDAVLVIPDLFDRNALALFVSSLFDVGFQHVAVIEEAVAATYGAGISAGCVVDIGAQTTTVACVDDGLCLADSRVHLDFGSNDMTTVFGKLLERISFPGAPDFPTLDSLKRQFFTVNEADISVQLYRYYTHNLKFDFKVYNEVMLPVLGLFYPNLFNIPDKKCDWKGSLFPVQMDPYTGHAAGPLSDADINIRMGTLAVLNQSYEKEPKISVKTASEEDDVSMLDDDDESRMGTPSNTTGPSATPSSAGAGASQMEAFQNIDHSLPAVAALDHAIIESIAQAQKHSGTAKLYYENLLVIGGGSKIPSFHSMLTDRLVMWNQSRLKEIGEVAVMAIPQGTDAESICWRGGCVYSKLKIIDEMWTSKDEWNVLGSRTLHYKAALYPY